MNKVSQWITKMLSESDGTPSTRRALFALAVVACLTFCAGYLVKKGMDDKLVDLAKTVLYTTGGATTIGKFAEGKKDPDEPAT